MWKNFDSGENRGVPTHGCDEGMIRGKAEKTF